MRKSELLIWCGGWYSLARLVDSCKFFFVFVSTTNLSEKWNVEGFKRMLSYEQHLEEKSCLWSSSFKKIDQPSWRTTRRNYKHIPQIGCISSRFRVLHLLSWEFERSEVLWRYTVILACHLKHVEFGWSTRNYPHTCHLSWTCTLSRWRLREVSIGRSKEDEKCTFFDISADFRAF